MARKDNAAPVDFITFKGQPFKLSPLTLAQQEEMAAYLRFSYLEEMKKHIEGLPGKLAEYAWDKAEAKAANIYPGRNELKLLLFTPLGLSYALHLAAQKHNAGFTQQQAYELLDEGGDDAISAVTNAAGFRPAVGKPENKALPTAEIIHVLCNEPYCHSPAEVWAMSLDEIAAIWCQPEGEQQGPRFSQADQDRWFEEARQAAEKRKLGIWGEDNIWPQ